MTSFFIGYVFDSQFLASFISQLKRNLQTYVAVCAWLKRLLNLKIRIVISF